MSGSTSTPRLGLPYLVPGQASPDAADASAKRLLDVLVQSSVISITNTPPGSPAEGDAYVCGTSPTGAWAGKANNLALRVGGGWFFAAPDSGDRWRVFNQADGQDYRWSGTAWAAITSGAMVVAIASRASTNQSIPNATLTAVSFDTEDRDDAGIYSAGNPTRMTVPSGYTKIRLTALVAWAANSTLSRYVIIRKNGTRLTYQVNMQANNESGLCLVTPWLTCASSDYFEMVVFQDSGAARDLSGSSATEKTYFQAELMP